MKTNLLYLTDPYQKEVEAEVIDVEIINKKLGKLILNQTIFFPEGGGQPSDQGRIVINDINFPVKQVRLEQNEIKHYVDIKDSLPKKGNCFLEIAWDRRYRNMQVHTAGHIIDWAISELRIHNDKLIPSKANHGKKAYISYIGKSNSLDQTDIQKRINKILKNNLKITSEFVEYEKLKEIALYIFPNLPKNKPLRIIEMEGYKPVPDGGTLVKKTGEIKSIVIENIEFSNQNTTVYYSLDQDEANKKKKTNVNLDKKNTNKIISRLEKIVTTSQQEVTKVSTTQMIESLRIKYLGRKSELTSILRSLKNFPYDIRAELGQKSNETKIAITSNIEKKYNELKKVQLNETLSTERIDVTEPGIKPNSEKGHIHPITQMLWKALDIFQHMGFEIIEPPEVDTDYNHFTALNIPEGHPARDMWDTFWTTDNQIAIAHTSTMQNRVLSQLKPPIRAVVPGKCFRNEATDARHEHTFYHLEGIYLDKNISLYHLTSVFYRFLEEFNERKTKIKIQPSYFPFVEPGLELLIECPKCRDMEKPDAKCQICHGSNWMELIGMGMIHPNVLKEAGIDPNIYSGFAWGFGVDRLVMVQYGINDIRLFHSGDLRFLKQF